MTASSHPIGYASNIQPVEQANKETPNFLGRFISIKNSSAKILLLALFIFSKFAAALAQNDTLCSNKTEWDVYEWERSVDFGEIMIPFMVITTLCWICIGFSFGFSAVSKAKRTIKEYSREKSDLDYKPVAKKSDDENDDTQVELEEAQ